VAAVTPVSPPVDEQPAPAVTAPVAPEPSIEQPLPGLSQTEASATAAPQPEVRVPEPQPETTVESVQPQTPQVSPTQPEAPAPVAPPVPAVPVPTLAERTAALVQGNGNRLSRSWQAIAQRAIAGDAIAQKDVAMSMLNGTHGFQRNAEHALELYRAAADAGVTQARVDLSYIKFHGLAGVTADRMGAAQELREIARSNRYASDMLHSLTGERMGTGRVTAAMRQAAAAVRETVAPAAGVPSSTADSASRVSMSWSQNAQGGLEARVTNAPRSFVHNDRIEVPIYNVR
jgi:TPR repeat protein